MSLPSLVPAAAAPLPLPPSARERLILSAWPEGDHVDVLADLRGTRQTRRAIEREFAKRIARRSPR